MIRNIYRYKYKTHDIMLWGYIQVLQLYMYACSIYYGEIDKPNILKSIWKVEGQT